jgi:hypothetical protein
MPMKRSRNREIDLDQMRLFFLAVFAPQATVCGIFKPDFPDSRNSNLLRRRRLHNAKWC